MWSAQISQYSPEVIFIDFSAQEKLQIFDVAERGRHANNLRPLATVENFGQRGFQQSTARRPITEHVQLVNYE